MPRPRKWRQVCCLPESDVFGPLNKRVGSANFIEMTVDEYESIRLIDLEGIMQEECAQRMNVGRTTVQRIYNSARKKMAESLVNGYFLKIKGGDYTLYGDPNCDYSCQRCHRRGHGHNRPM